MWGLNHSPHEGTKPRTPLYFLFPSPPLLRLEKKTMVACETWRGALCYACSMACHCASYNAFTFSPTREFITTTTTNHIMSKTSSTTTRCRPFLLSITNATPSYNTLVSEVPFSPLTAFICHAILIHSVLLFACILDLIASLRNVVVFCCCGY